MLSTPNTRTDISGWSLSNLAIACKLIGSSIPLKLRDSVCFLKCFVISSDSQVFCDPRSFVFCFFFIMLIWCPTVVSQHLSKNDKRGWLTRWPPRSFANPIWHSAPLFTLFNYCAIVFSFALMFANGWLTACDGFYDASACWLSHMKQ